jgi:hypothetical protein
MKGAAHVLADITAQQRTEYISDKIPLELTYSSVGREMSIPLYEDGGVFCAPHSLRS